MSSKSPSARRVPVALQRLAESSGVSTDELLAAVCAALERRPLWLMPDVLDVREVAEAINLSETSVRYLIREKQLPKLDCAFADRVLVAKRSVEQLLESWGWKEAP